MLNRKLKSEFIKVASLENQMKAEITKMKQLLVEAEAEEQNQKKGLSKAFKTAARKRQANSVTQSVITDQLFDFGASGSLFSSFLDMCDALSPELTEMVSTASDKGAMEAIVELRDQLTTQPTTKKNVETALEKDMKKQAKDKKVALGEKNTLEGTKSRLDMMNDRFADVQTARQSGVQYVELNETGLDIPKKPGYYRRMNKAPKMALAA